MSLTIVKKETDETVTLHLKGVLDYSTTNLINPYLDELEEISELKIDFEDLEFIDSTGIGSILDAIYLSQEKNFHIELEGVDELTNEVLDMVGIYKILGVVQKGGYNV